MVKVTPDELLRNARTLLERHGLNPQLPDPARDTGDARRESSRVRGMFSDVKAREITRRARQLGAISSDDQLLCSLRHLVGLLDAEGMRSIRGCPLTAATVQRALQRCGVRATNSPLPPI